MKQRKHTILPDTHPLMREVSAPVVEFGPALNGLVEHMTEAMDERGGIGLAAVQVGAPLRVIIARPPGEALLAMVNPVITRTLNRAEVAREGCLSVEPRNWGNVSRPAKCEITWQDLEGKSHSGGFRGQMARVLQHEIDHLDGVLITDKRLGR